MKQWKVVTYMDARLEPYRTLVSFLGEALGPDYEVVLHDLTSEEGTIAAIVNNNISGRTEGAPLSNMALRFIHGRVYEAALCRGLSRCIAGQGAAALLHYVYQRRQRAYRDALHQL